LLRNGLSKVYVFSLLSEAEDFNALERIILRLLAGKYGRLLEAYLRFLDTS